MPTLMVTNPFFPFKNRPSQNFGPYSSASINVKTGSSDLADFATTRPLIHWRVLAICTMFGRPLAYHSVMAWSDQVGSYKNPPKSAGCDISGKVPWQISL
jgi:hypothetical protein